MGKEEILVVRKEKGRGNDKLNIKVCDKETNKWSPSRYEKIIASKDYNLLAYLFYDLNSMGYNIEKAYLKFRTLLNEPELFFLK
jgi:hypothetical protein